MGAAAKGLGGFGEINLVAVVKLQVEADLLNLQCVKNDVQMSFQDPIEYLEDVVEEMPPAELEREAAGRRPRSSSTWINRQERRKQGGAVGDDTSSCVTGTACSAPGRPGG